MLIPIGLIGFAMSAIEQERANAARHSMQLASAHHQFQARGYELWEACTGPDACLLVITGADVRACTIDGVSMARAQPASGSASAAVPVESAAYRSAAQLPSAAGLFAVCAGLHRIRTTTASGGEVDTFLSLNPREARAFALDANLSAFVAHEPDHEAALVEGALAGPLYDYNAFVAGARIQSPSIQSAKDALDAAEKWLQQAVQAVAKGVPVKAFELAASARGILAGVPVSSFARLTDFIGFHAFELQQRGEQTKARTVVDAGLVALPDSPTLLAVLGMLQSRAGEASGQSTLQRALRRGAWMPPALRAQAEALIAPRAAMSSG
ncbi:MAG: hypothetical protein HOO96_44285 [Polyangiaceae bacterium]|nr:hypothetical protein [Polyangiaceae bacterium]